MSRPKTPTILHHHTVRLHETDGAGILFYGQIFTLAHNAHEELLFTAELSPRQIFENHPFSIPLVHAEADYLSPIRLSERLTLKVWVEKIGEHSFTLRTEVESCDADGKPQPKAVVTTVHVTIDVETGKAIPIPTPLLQLLNDAS